MQVLKKIGFYICLMTIGIYHTFGQGTEIINPPTHIKSVVFKNGHANDFSPMVQLGRSFRFSFDDLQDDQYNYSYQIDHYTHDWKPSGLGTTEFINGYASDRIRDFENSFNTFQNYTHYSFQLPNKNSQIKLSGNYILSILNEDDEVILSRRFVVYEPLVTVGLSAHKSKDITHLNTAHSLEALINYPNFRINNPNAEIKVVLLQNFDWNNTISDFKPQYHRGTQLIYKQNDLSFFAGNEYQFFDTKEIRNPVNKIARAELKDVFHTYLYRDEARAEKPYTFKPDVNGNFIVRTVDTDDSRLEADYSKVFFTLDAFGELNDHDIYVSGNFNNWQFTEENKMIFNATSRFYKANILLKQGFYNYTYVAVGRNGQISPNLLEGSFYQTENDYTMLVYHRAFGTKYDRLIGIGSANSKQLRN